MGDVAQGLPTGAKEPPRWEVTGEVPPREGGRAVGFSGSEYQRAGDGMAVQPGVIGSNQVKARPRFRRYTRDYKLRVLKDTDTLGEGEVGAYLRREGLYYSTLKMFREHRTRGMLDERYEARRGPADSGRGKESEKGGAKTSTGSSSSNERQASVDKGTAAAAPAVVVPAETQRRMNELEKENRKLRHRLRQTDALIELQKKASELLGISLEGLEPNDE